MSSATTSTRESPSPWRRAGEIVISTAVSICALPAPVEWPALLLTNHQLSPCSSSSAGHCAVINHSPGRIKPRSYICPHFTCEGLGLGWIGRGREMNTLLFLLLKFDTIVWGKGAFLLMSVNVLDWLSLSLLILYKTWLVAVLILLTITIDQSCDFQMNWNWKEVQQTFLVGFSVPHSSHRLSGALKDPSSLSPPVASYLILSVSEAPWATVC